MKNIIIGAVLSGLFFAPFFANAGDDVYDEFSPKREKVKSTQPQEKAPTTQYPSSNSQDRTSPSFGNNNSDPYYSEDDNTNYSTSYSDRIQRFHNPGVSFSASYGYGGGYNNYGNYYDPYYANAGWYNSGYSQNYWYTPSFYWDYYNFWNPFTTQVIIINRPWQNNWGWCNDPWSNFGWNSYSYNAWNNPWYNPYNNLWTPTCHNIVSNNYGWDYSRNNTVYTPRVNTTTNSPNFNNSQRNSNNSNYQYNYTKGNNGSMINKQQKTIVPQNYNNNNNDNYYKPQPNNNSNPNLNNNNSGNNNSNDNNWGTRETESGIKVNKKPK